MYKNKNEIGQEDWRKWNMRNKVWGKFWFKPRVTEVRGISRMGRGRCWK